MKQGLLIALVALAAIAAEQLGEAIKLKTGSDGKLALGIVYTLGAQDPDGNNYFLNITKSGDALPKGTKWNIYRRDTDSYVYGKWPVSDAAISAWQLKIDDKGPVRKVLPFQKEVVLVFETPNGTRYHLDLGSMCGKKEFEGYFKNMTSNKRCDEITADDLGPEPTRHNQPSDRDESEGH